MFVHSARTPSDIIFRRELEAMASTAPALRVVPSIASRTRPREPWGGLRGFLSAEMLALVAPDLHERVVFCCGPAPYMAAVRRMLNEGRLGLQNYHGSPFSFEDLTMKEFATAAGDDLPDADGADAAPGGRTRWSSCATRRRSPAPTTRACSTPPTRPGSTRVIVRAGHVRHLQGN